MPHSSLSRKCQRGNAIGEWDAERQILTCLSANDPASIRNSVDVRAHLIGETGVIQLAGTDRQKVRITRHTDGITEAEYCRQRAGSNYEAHSGHHRGGIL